MTGNEIKWQTIHTVPTDGTPVLVYDADKVIGQQWNGYQVAIWAYDAARDVMYWEVDGTEGFSLDSYTHWMPLPPPPEG